MGTYNILKKHLEGWKAPSWIQGESIVKKRGGETWKKNFGYQDEHRESA